MARGWESKSVESQIDAASEEPRGKSKAALTEAEKTMHRERETLMLARSQVLRQIESASNERYAESLRQGLRELDAKIAKLQS